MFGRNKIAMLVAEFLGTGVLTLVVLAVQRSTIGIPYFVAIAGGLTVGALSLLLANASGAHLNPAITIGAWTARKVKTLPALMYIIAQLLGGWAAYALYTYFVNSHFQSIGGHFTWRLLIAEAVGAFVFAFGWAAVAAQRLSASLFGAMFAVGMLIASIASVGLINPAVAIGTRAWAGWGKMGWGTYALGPVLGAMAAFLLYDLLFTENMLGLRANTAAAPAATAPVAPVAKRGAGTRAKTVRRTTTTRRRTSR